MSLINNDVKSSFNQLKPINNSNFKNPAMHSSVSQLEKNQTQEKATSQKNDAPINLFDRNKVLENGTYKQAYNDLQSVLQPIIQNLNKLYGKPNKNSDDFSFRPVIENNLDNTEKFDVLLDETLSNISKKSFGFQDIVHLKMMVDILKKNDKTDPQSREGQHFKQSLNFFDKQINDKVFQSPNKPIQFVLNLLQGIGTIERLEDTINQLQQSPLNQNEDLRLLSNQLTGALRNIQQVGHNITAHAQSSQFDVNKLKEHVRQLPYQFEALDELLSHIGENSKVQGNQEYVDLIAEVYHDTLQMISFFTPEIEKSLDTDTLKTNSEAGKVIDIKENQNKDKLSVDLPFAIQNPLIGQSVAQEPLQKNQISQSNGMNWQPAPNLAYESQQKALENTAFNNPNYTMDKASNVNQLLNNVPTANPVTQTSPMQNDKQIEALQELWSKAYQARDMKNKINAVNQIGQNMQEMAMAGTGKPNPEMVALTKRSKRLNSLQNLMTEVPKVNKATQDLEKSALEAQHAYMVGVNKIATQRLKNDIDSAHMQSEQQKAYARGLEKLGTDGLEIATNMAKNYEKIVGMFTQIIEMRINNVWDSIKRLVRGFKF